MLKSRKIMLQCFSILEIKYSMPLCYINMIYLYNPRLTQKGQPLILPYILAKMTTLLVGVGIGMSTTNATAIHWTTNTTTATTTSLPPLPSNQQWNWHTSAGTAPFLSPDNSLSAPLPPPCLLKMFLSLVADKFPPNPSISPGMLPPLFPCNSSISHCGLVPS